MSSFFVNQELWSQDSRTQVPQPVSSWDIGVLLDRALSPALTLFLRRDNFDFRGLWRLCAVNREKTFQLNGVALDHGGNSFLHTKGPIMKTQSGSKLAFFDLRFLTIFLFSQAGILLALF